MCEAAPWPGPGYIVYTGYTGYILGGPSHHSEHRIPSTPGLWGPTTGGKHIQNLKGKSSARILPGFHPIFTIFPWFGPALTFHIDIWMGIWFGCLLCLPLWESPPLGPLVREEGAALWHYDGHSRQLGAGQGPHLALCQCNLTPPCGEQSWQHSFQITTNVSCLCLQFM